MATTIKEGNLEAPTRHPINWKDPDFYNQDSLFNELERVFDLCHGCRRCVSLCQSFPTLFDLVDESSTMEVDGVDKKDYWQVVDHCYLCDLCYMTKCPYTPPHEWGIDFPHLMLRAKAVKHNNGDSKLRDKLLTNTDALGKLGSIPVVAQSMNSVNNMGIARSVLDKVAGIHPKAKLPDFHSDTFRKRMKNHTSAVSEVKPAGRTSGKVALFVTCYGNVNSPDICQDIVRVYEHNNIPVVWLEKEQCCGMPKLELGDLKAVEASKNANIPKMLELVNQGYDIIAPIPSCALMYKQELPLMFPDEDDVISVGKAIFDPFEYLMIRHQEGLLNTDFSQTLGKVAYHTACHQRVQNIGQKTRDVLSLVPDTEVKVIERCSGHDGTYAIKSEFHEHAMKIVKPVVNQVKQFEPDHYGSDCAMAGHHIENAWGNGQLPEHPMTLIRKAYGL